MRVVAAVAAAIFALALSVFAGGFADSTGQISGRFSAQRDFFTSLGDMPLTKDIHVSDVAYDILSQTKFRSTYVIRSAVHAVAGHRGYTGADITAKRLDREIPFYVFAANAVSAFARESKLTSGRLSAILYVQDNIPGTVVLATTLRDQLCFLNGNIRSKLLLSVNFGLSGDAGSRCIGIPKSGVSVAVGTRQGGGAVGMGRSNTVPSCLKCERKYNVPTKGEEDGRKDKNNHKPFAAGLLALCFVGCLLGSLKMVSNAVKRSDHLHVVLVLLAFPLFAVGMVGLLWVSGIAPWLFRWQ